MKMLDADAVNDWSAKNAASNSSSLICRDASSVDHGPRAVIRCTLLPNQREASEKIVMSGLP
jgi:hypothetical protein